VLTILILRKEKQVEHEEEGDKEVVWTEQEKESKRLEKEVLLPNIIITLAVLHQGTDFFVQHNILNKVYPVPRKLALNFGSGGGSTRSCSICSSGRVSDHPQG